MKRIRLGIGPVTTTMCRDVFNYTARNVLRIQLNYYFYGGP